MRSETLRARFKRRLKCHDVVSRPPTPNACSRFATPLSAVAVSVMMVAAVGVHLANGFLIIESGYARLPQRRPSLAIVRFRRRGDGAQREAASDWPSPTNGDFGYRPDGVRAIRRPHARAARPAIRRTWRKPWRCQNSWRLRRPCRIGRRARRKEVCWAAKGFRKELRIFIQRVRDVSAIDDGGRMCRSCGVDQERRQAT
jgi:hypothetical protein